MDSGRGWVSLFRLEEIHYLLLSWCVQGAGHVWGGVHGLFSRASSLQEPGRGAGQSGPILVTSSVIIKLKKAVSRDFLPFLCSPLYSYNCLVTWFFVYSFEMSIVYIVCTYSIRRHKIWRTAKTTQRSLLKGTVTQGFCFFTETLGV